MKRNSWLLGVILCITTCLVALSCANCTNTDDANNKKQSFTLVPICWGNHNGELRSFAMRNSNGEFIMFDNDVDWSDYCYAISFICEVSDQYKSMFYDIWRQPEEKWQICNEIINGTMLFLQNKKQEIQDPKILEAIEKAYYDTMSKISQEYYISKYGYGWKNYTPMSYPGQYCFNRVFTGSWNQELKKEYTTEKDIEIPEGALIFTIREWMFGHLN